MSMFTVVCVLPDNKTTSLDIDAPNAQDIVDNIGAILDTQNDDVLLALVCSYDTVLHAAVACGSTDTNHMRDLPLSRLH